MRQDRQLTVIMFTDIVGYSSLMENNENEALYLLEINRQLIQSALNQHKGKWTKDIGDGTLSTFNSTVNALNCAISILKLIKEFPKLNLRIGLHLGDIIQEEQDIFGDGVNIASRIQHLAPPNGLAVSHHFHAQLQGKSNLVFHSIGFPPLKNIRSKVEIFVWDPKKTKTHHSKEHLSLIDHTHASVKFPWNKVKIASFALILIFTSVAAWQFYRQDSAIPHTSSNSQAKIDKNSIAVLKFKHIGKQEENQYFNEGLSEELLNLLARINELKVASRTSTWALPNDITAAQVREQLKVNYLVEGSVRKSLDKIRITVQLIATESGFHLWTETYDRKIDDVIKVQDEIAQKITQSLKLILSAQSLEKLTAQNNINAQAYDDYLQAKKFLRLSKTKQNLAQAINYFNSAITRENEFALAYAGLCDSQIEWYKITLVHNDFNDAEKNCLNILKSNSYQSEIYNSLGKLYLISGRYQDAEHHFQAALTLNLSSIDALIGMGKTLSNLNDNPQAEQYFKRAIQVDPTNSESHDHYATFLFYQGKNKQAINEFKKVIALTPNYGPAYNSLGAAYFASGEITRAIDIFQQSLTIHETQEAYSNLGTAYFIEKNFELAAKMYQQAIRLSPEDYRYWGFLGESLEHIPEQKQAMLEAYQRAISIAEQSQFINDNNFETSVSLALYYAKTQKNDKALELLNTLADKDLLPELLYTISISYLSLNDHQQSLNFLEKAIKQGYDKEVIHSDENFAALYKNQQFIELTSK